MRSLRGRPRKLKKSVRAVVEEDIDSESLKYEVRSLRAQTSDFILQTSLSSEGATASAGRFGVRVVEDEALADQVRVVVEHRTVQKNQALLVDENLRAIRR